MNFLVDAQLPRHLADQLRAAGHNALHTLDLPAGNRRSRPPKLLLVSSGNISNEDLRNLLENHLAQISAALLTNDFVELTRSTLVIRG